MTFFVSAFSQLPSAQNYPYVKVTCFGVTSSAAIHWLRWLMRLNVFLTLHTMDQFFEKK